MVEKYPIFPTCHRHSAEKSGRYGGHSLRLAEHESEQSTEFPASNEQFIDLDWAYKSRLMTVEGQVSRVRTGEETGADRKFGSEGQLVRQYEWFLWLTRPVSGGVVEGIGIVP
jgi:hypothetical protein